VNQELQQFLLAAQFLTRIPVGRWITFRAENLPQSAKYFPLIGALIGAASALVFAACARTLPGSLAILFSMLATVLLTGALHEDGLADTADGLGGSTRERALEIMRDSRLGTFGAVALWFSLTLKFALLQWLDTRGFPLWRVLAATPLLSRCAAVALLATCENARASSATSGAFTGKVSLETLGISVAYTLLLSALLLRQSAFSCALAVFFSVVLLRRLFLQRLGGITGDCLGAAIQISELAVLFALSA